MEAHWAESLRLALFLEKEQQRYHGLPQLFLVIFALRQLCCIHPAAKSSQKAIRGLMNPAAGAACVQHPQIRVAGSQNDAGMPKG